jgi:DNA-binding MarR family transcriptional regulator
LNPSKKSESIDFLLASVCHLHRSRAQQLFETLGLYRGQPALLHVLWLEEGLTQAELAARMRLTPATLTRMVQRMEKAGFVRRAPDPADQRVLRVFLTGRGQAVRGEVERVFLQMEAETFAGLDESERSVLRGLLLRLRENLLGVAGGGPPWN